MNCHAASNRRFSPGPLPDLSSSAAASTTTPATPAALTSIEAMIIAAGAIIKWDNRGRGVLQTAQLWRKKLRLTLLFRSWTRRMETTTSLLTAATAPATTTNQRTKHQTTTFISDGSAASFPDGGLSFSLHWTRQQQQQQQQRFKGGLTVKRAFPRTTVDNGRSG